MVVDETRYSSKRFKPNKLSRGGLKGFSKTISKAKFASPFDIPEDEKKKATLGFLNYSKHLKKCKILSLT